MTANSLPGPGIRLVDALTGETHNAVIKRLVISGFTGRNRPEVEAHLDELRTLDVPVPETTPAFYELDPALVTTADVIEVDNVMTSGEVEPVVVNVNGEWLLCVGSDHTDRDIERSSIEMSKAACPKVISSSYVHLEAISDWDGIRIRSWLDGEPTPYQDGSLAELMPLPAVFDRATQAVGPLGEGVLLFLGTLPIADGRLRPSAYFAGELKIPNVDDPLSVFYRILRKKG